MGAKARMLHLVSFVSLMTAAIPGYAWSPKTQLAIASYAASFAPPDLERQIEMVNPRLILAVGRIAAQHLLHSDSPLGRMRGRVHSLHNRQVPVVVTYHPAYLLRSPSQKRKVWDDLCLARQTVEESQT